MTTINESQTAKGYTPAALVPQVFGRARTIEGIVIHHWGSLGQRHDDVVKFFVSGPGTTSAHFVVSAGRIDCLVSPPDAAWHSGNAVGNATTIGIECHPEATDADYATVAELVSFLRSQYGPLPLSPHRQWSSTACPGVWDLAKIDRLAGSAAINPESATVQEDTLSQAEADQIINKVYAFTTTLFKQYHAATINELPAATLSKQFKLADGTSTNLAGLLDQLHSRPSGSAPASVDVEALVARLKAELPAAMRADIAAKLIQP